MKGSALYERFLVLLLFSNISFSQNFMFILFLFSYISFSQNLMFISLLFSYISFSQNIPPAKKELAGLNRFSTPMGRLFCIKRVVTALTRPLKSASSNEGTSICISRSGAYCNLGV